MTRSATPPLIDSNFTGLLRLEYQQWIAIRARRRLPLRRTCAQSNLSRAFRLVGEDLHVELKTFLRGLVYPGFWNAKFNCLQRLQVILSAGQLNGNYSRYIDRT
jgi:hypothetical protein